MQPQVYNPNVTRTQPQQANEDEDESSKPSSIYAWFIHIVNLYIIISMTLWPIIAQPLITEIENYCKSTYFDGYNSAQCSESAMKSCYQDSKCALYHDFFDRDDNFFCSDDSDCIECKCIESNIQSCIIALWVFVSIGLVMEFIRFAIALSITSQNQINEHSKILSIISDTFAIRLIQCLNPSLYKQYILHIYWMRKWFGINVFIIVKYILVYLPCYICAFIIFGMDTANGFFGFLLFSTLILQILIIFAKIRYRNGTPYMDPKQVPQFNANALPTQQPVVMYSNSNQLQPQMMPAQMQPVAVQPMVIQQPQV